MEDIDGDTETDGPTVACSRDGDLILAMRHFLSGRFFFTINIHVMPRGPNHLVFFLEKVVLLVNIFESIVCLASLEMSINVQNTSINGLKRKISIFGVSPLPWKS